ncbi:MAG: CpsD/CapB family tyrosine-protein kinase [Chloroflexus sp.]|jgi:non-specific protein-tyrosine kinase|uniref:CpsD/CapB family tyrosine-protein kinase n=1 Tax=unclassified Chloroflexus TaxID=2633855 RepID=UPI0004DF0882|nr:MULTISPECIES: CpsD/CapB family tyrosine-protein kinase [unclassified Chloroflexus]MBO9311101.1 CpsD/CapB family tyrosine-protein kinase [Chloroflexus sp.]MBO9315450.1 CpsD/CapB family tyrosine-protein kinase [Chloroflexus sp.]MBO9339770.1 CpsD/CapB family tyrosine-protein kinase [Chloroflexus sp.]MBO9347997.1 CpsD/CapB family tyrosine-protein kinase [Chloroflexus sp.]MBO9372883.1 CpsD/CapB family tyrosine-protein kinase [Chloroflexus sp.]
MIVTSSPEQVLITLREPASAAAEAYRTLRTNILFSSLDKPIHTLLLTSAEQTPDKSLTAANLAVTMAQAEQRVLLVDCDLRQPTLHTIFGLSNEQGLTSAILDQEAPLAIQPTEVPGLSLLPSGPLPPRPADLLGSRRMEGLLNRLRQIADIVIFDTPPVQPFTDALVLATRVDGVLLVIQAGRSRRDRVREARQKLEKVKANLLGVVLSGARI